MGIIIVMVERIKIREGEINHLALGVFNIYGSPRKEKMIWSCLGERSLRLGE